MAESGLSIFGGKSARRIIITVCLEWGMLNRVSNVICHDKKFWRQISKGQEQCDVLLDGKKGLKLCLTVRSGG